MTAPSTTTAPSSSSALPGALEAIARLNHAGWHVVLASNQSGLGRGLFEVSALNDIHTKMHQQLTALGGRIDAVFYCPHTAEDGCRCRKPAAGLLELIAERYGLHLRGVPMVGDALRDVQAGVALGCEPHLVLTGKGAAYRGQSLPDTFPPDTQVARSLAHVSPPNAPHGCPGYYFFCSCQRLLHKDWRHKRLKKTPLLQP